MSSFSADAAAYTVQQVADLKSYQTPWTAKRELFTKTLALCTSLQEHGCAFQSDELPREEDSGSDTVDSADSDSELCRGRLVLKKNGAGQYLIESVVC